MPANKYALIRYRVIDDCLTNKYRPYPTKEDLRRACEDALYGSQNQRVSVSTIEKDLFAMRNDVALGYEAPIQFDKGEKGYYYHDKDYTIKKVPLGEEDLEALWFASQTLYQFKDVPVFQAFEQMIGKLREHVSLSDNELDSEYLDHMLFDESHKGQGDRYIPELLKAIRERNKIKVKYSFYDEDKDDKEYDLEPLLLKQFRLNWYLIARDAEAEKIKTFGLDRFVELAVLPSMFISPNFNAKEFFKDTYGISHLSHPPEKVVLQVEKPLSNHILAAPMHESMRRVSGNEYFDRIEMEVVVNLDLVNELMTWMPQIRIIAPEKLRYEVVKRCETAINKNIIAT